MPRCLAYKFRNFNVTDILTLIVFSVCIVQKLMPNLLYIGERF